MTPDEIRRVFFRKFCLICILATRNRDSPNIWKAKIPQPSTTTPPDTNQQTTSTPLTNTEAPPDHSWPIGALIYYGNVGRISPASLDTHNNFWSSVILALNKSSRTPPSRLKTKIYSSMALRFFTSQPYAATTTAVSARHSPKNFTNHITALTRRRQPTINGRMPLNATSRPSMPTCQPPSTAKTWSYAAKHWLRVHYSLPHSVNNLTTNPAGWIVATIRPQQNTSVHNIRLGRMQI